MSLVSLLNQDASIYAKTGYGKTGKDISSDTATTVKCRFQNKTVTKTGRDGQVVQLLGIVYLNGSVSINTEDRITIGGNNYKVFSVNGSIDGRSNQRLVKCEVQRWQQ